MVKHPSLRTATRRQTRSRRVLVIYLSLVCLAYAVCVQPRSKCVQISPAIGCPSSSHLALIPRHLWPDRSELWRAPGSQSYRPLLPYLTQASPQLTLGIEHRRQLSVEVLGIWLDPLSEFSQVVSKYCTESFTGVSYERNHCDLADVVIADGCPMRPSILRLFSVRLRSFDERFTVLMGDQGTQVHWLSWNSNPTPINAW